MKTATNQVSDRFGEQIWSRDPFRVIEREFENSDAEELCIDLASVTFLSRAAADELLSLLRKIKKSENKQFNLINTHEEVKKMLFVVSKGKKDMPDLPIAPTR